MDTITAPSAVKSERKGSYLVDLSIQSAIAVSMMAPLINKENMATIKNVASKVVSTATKGYELWKKLKGEKPKEVTEKPCSLERWLFIKNFLDAEIRCE